MRKTYCNPIVKNGDFADPFVMRYDGRYYLYGTNPDVRCWVSDDLIDWTLCGPTIDEDEFPGLVPFAPEVVYHNGFFYMYTSPHGRGHFVLRSESPTGPFKKITGNIGHAIDFSVFLDEDGKWYAYWADDMGILGCEMGSPTEFGEPKLIGAYLHGWTEGPFIVKDKGKYHLTYTGNHYLSKGYRIHASVSDHPLGPYTDVADNPVIVRTQGDVVGLGHSSTVLGPNLLSHYIFYHNLNPDRTRDLNLDEVIFDPEGMIVLGPTCHKHTAPCMPDVFCHGVKRIPGRLPACGVLEMNMSTSNEAGRYGVMMDNAQVIIDKHVNRLMVLQTGEEVGRYMLPVDYRHEALHTLRVCWQEGNCIIWLDNLRVYEGQLIISGASASFVGEAVIPGYAAYTEKAECHPELPGRLPAGRNLSLCTQEEMYTLTWTHASDGAYFELDGVRMQIAEGEFARRKLAFSSGEHRLFVQGLSGAKAVPLQTAGLAECVQVNGLGPWQKAVYTKPMMDADIDVECTVNPCEDSWAYGVLIRASELALGGEGNDPLLGKDFMIGYRVAISTEGVSLYRHRYDCICLAKAACASGKLRISVRGNIIEVYAQGQCVIRYEDEKPVLFGGMGFDARGCMMSGKMTCTPVLLGGYDV